MATYSLQYRSEPESEERILNELEEILQDHQIEAQLLHSVKLVISEAFTNALVHGNKREPDKQILVRIRVSGKWIQATVLDEGKKGLQSISRREQPTVMSEGGRGIDLIQLYANSVKFAETDSGGLKVFVSFDRKRRKSEKVCQ